MSEDDRNSMANPDAITSTIGKRFDKCIFHIILLLIILIYMIS